MVAALDEGSRERRRRSGRTESPRPRDISIGCRSSIGELHPACYSDGNPRRRGAPFFATKFYIAEAERHLADVKAAKTAGAWRRSVPGPNAAGELNLAAKAIDAPILAHVKKAYQDAQGKFESGKLSLDELFEWSERYRQAAERLAADQAGKVQAAQDHLERMKKPSAALMPRSRPVRAKAATTA